MANKRIRSFIQNEYNLIIKTICKGFTDKHVIWVKGNWEEKNILQLKLNWG